MRIIHIVDDFLFELFPKAKAAGNDIEVLPELKLPYDEEYNVAEKMFNGKQ